MSTLSGPRTHRRRRWAFAVLAVLGLFLGVGLGALRPSAAPEQPVQTLFGPAAPEGAGPETEDFPVELGTRFAATQPGLAVGVRYWSEQDFTGARTGRLWDPDGRLVAQVTFPDEAGTGWRRADFEHPVRLLPDQVYVVSYEAPDGRLVRTNSHHPESRSSALRTADGEAGVYSDTAGSFPRDSWGGTTYWADVVFRPDGPVATPAPLASDGTAPPVAIGEDAPSVGPELPTGQLGHAPETSEAPSTTGRRADGATTPSGGGGGGAAEPSPSSGGGQAPSPGGGQSSGAGGFGPSTGVPAGFPDAGSTGPSGALTRVPEEATEGPGWAVRTAGGDTFIEVTGDGATLANIRTSLPVEVLADHVTVRNVLVSASGETWGIGMRGATGTVIENVEVGAPAGATRLKTAIKDIDGRSRGTVVRNSELYRTSTGIQMGDGTLEGNYIHDIMAIGDDHSNGITSNVSTGTLRIVGNTVLVPLDQTDAVGIFQDFGPQRDVLIQGNLLAGGSYAVYGGDGGRGATSNIVIRDNVFSTRYFPRSGAYGPVTAFTPGGPGNLWDNNVWESDRSAQVPPP